MVVRNPFDRMVSEFNYFNEEKTLKVIEFNSQLINKIIRNANNKRGNHYSPQYLYCKKEPCGFPNLGRQWWWPNQNGNLHILRYENLDEEFSNLMGLYGINITLPDKQLHDEITNSSKYWQKQRLSKTFTTKDLSQVTIDTIIKYYKEDFNTFNYKKEAP